MDELPHPGIEAPVGLHVAEGGDEGGTLPAVDLVGGGKLLPVDVDDLDVGGDDFIEAVIGRAVYLLGHGQAVAAGLRESDDLLEPGRAGGLEVNACALFADDLSDTLVEAELIASGVYRELEALRQAEGLGAPLGDADVSFELFEEGSDIADIVDTLVEAARILGRYGLDGNVRIGQGGEDDDEFGGALGNGGFVHRHLGDEIISLPQLADAAIGLGRLVDSTQITSGRCPDRGSLEARGYAFSRGQIRVFRHEGLDCLGSRALADVVSDINGEEVAVGGEAVDCGHADMVGVDVPGAVPARLSDSPRGGRTLVGGLGTRKEMLAVALVPYYRDIDALFPRLPDSCDLRGTLVPEAVPGAYGIPCNHLHGDFPVPRIPDESGVRLWYLQYKLMPSPRQ